MTDAMVEVTYGGFHGTLANPVLEDVTDAQLRQIVAEALSSGSIVGVAAVQNPDLTDFVIDRWPANEVRATPTYSLRPKTPFGYSV